MSSTKLQVHKVLHCHQRRIEPQPQVTSSRFMTFQLSNMLCLELLALLPCDLFFHQIAQQVHFFPTSCSLPFILPSNISCSNDSRFSTCHNHTRLRLLTVSNIVTRQRSWSFAEYCKHFVAHLNDVHAFGYNSNGSERIWMKFGNSESIVWSCPWQILGAIRAEAATGGRAEFFFVHYVVSISPTSGRPNFTKFARKDVFPCPHVGLSKTFVKICP